MPVPNYGAKPLAETFLIVRTFQLIAFIAVLGITGNFVSEIVATGYTVSREVVGTLSITSIAALYCLITIPFFWAEASLGLLIMATFDFLLMLAFVVISVVLGKPLSYMDCSIINKASASEDAASAYVFTMSIGQNLGKDGNFVGWTGETKSNCYESKAVWGMSIALCILFAISVLLLPALFAKHKRAQKTATKAGAGWGA